MPALATSELEALYRELHRHPELSMREVRTAALVRERMGLLGFETIDCGGGVAAVLRNGAGPVVAFRAELDGLPVREETGVDFASEEWGELPDRGTVPVMHACGHDVHLTCAIGAASVLAASRGAWTGTLVMLFQPGEETGEGARSMLDDGLWQRVPVPEILYAQHVSTNAVGTVELSTGPAMAMADSWHVTVHGRGGHGSQPEATVDPIVLAAHMIVRIQSVVSRELGAQESAVVTIGSMRGGDSPNVIPSTAEFTVNIRALDAEVRARVHAALRRVLDAEARASDAPPPMIDERQSFPVLVNDPDATRAVSDVLRATLGEHGVRIRPPLMGSEDIGHLAAAIDAPIVYWFLGGFAPSLEGEAPPPNHSPQFIPLIEPTLETGVRAAVAVLRARLGAAHETPRES